MGFLRFLWVLGACASLAAWGNSTGIAGNPQPNCNGCHQGGAAPTVTLTGPQSIVAGAQNQSYTLTVSGGAGVVGGFNIAASVPQVTWVAAAGQRVDQAQLTQTGKANFNNGTLQVVFALNAPSSAGSFSLTARGLSGNNGNGPNGDRATDANLTVTVTAPAGGDRPSDAPALPPSPTSPADSGVVRPADAGLPVIPLGDGGVDPYLLPPKVDTSKYDGWVEAGCSSTKGNPASMLWALCVWALRRRRQADNNKTGQKPTASHEAST